MSYIVARLREPSTWVGLFAILSGIAGHSFAPEFISNVTAAGVAGAGLAAMALNTSGQ
jgi:hypothetical protein